MEILNLQLEKYKNEIEMVKEALEDIGNQSEENDIGKSEILNEIEKYTKYLENTENLKTQLKRIDISQEHQLVGNGSLVETENNFFFIAAALGKLDLNDGKNYYSISVEAPIYQSLKEKKAGDSFEFNTMKYKVVSVS